MLTGARASAVSANVAGRIAKSPAAGRGQEARALLSEDAHRGARAVATPAWAWGRLRHRVTSRLAEKHLTPAAKDAIAEQLEPGESLADASLWADPEVPVDHRRAGVLWSSGTTFHMVDGRRFQRSQPASVRRHRSIEHGICASVRRHRRATNWPVQDSFSARAKLRVCLSPACGPMLSRQSTVAPFPRSLFEFLAFRGFDFGGSEEPNPTTAVNSAAAREGGNVAPHLTLVEGR